MTLPALRPARSWPAILETIARDAALTEDRQRWALPPHSDAAPPFAYRWEHVQAVVRLAGQLVAAEGSDWDVVLAAAWLHDTQKRHTYHSGRGADYAREVLPRTDFPAAKIDAVAHAIAHHEGLWRPAPGWQEPHPFVAAPPLAPLETAILWDADKLAKIGPTGLLHGFGFGLAQGEDLASFAATAMWWREHFSRTLASFNTPSARAWARERYLVVLRFFDVLAVETASPQA